MARPYFFSQNFCGITVLFLIAEKARLRTVEISMFAVGYFPCCGDRTSVLRISHDVSTTRSHWFRSGFSRARAHIGLKRDAVGSRGCVAENIFFSPPLCFGFSVSPRGIFPCNAIFAYPPFYAVSLRLASPILIVPGKNTADSPCRRWQVRFWKRKYATKWKSIKYFI